MITRHRARSWREAWTQTMWLKVRTRTVRAPKGRNMLWNLGLVLCLYVFEYCMWRWVGSYRNARDMSVPWAITVI